MNKEITEITSIENQDSKSVKYLNELLIVPYWTNYIAVDKNGTLCCYEEKPLLSDKEIGQWTNAFGLYEPIYLVTINFDWKESLVNIF